MNRKTGIPAIDADSEKLEKLENRSKFAKGLVGKLFSIPHADGAAYYTIEEEKGAKVRIVNHALLDAWQDTVLGTGGWFPRKQIEPIVRRQEASTKMFEEMANTQRCEKHLYADIVGAAALHDLGDAADIYDLASWAWKRSFRGTVKDQRIENGKRMQSANDIASTLADSNRFPALQALKDKIPFIMLADKFSDPIVYANDPPSDAAMLTAVKEAFLLASGAAPSGLYLVETESKYLDNTSFTIMNGQSNKVGTVYYDPKDASILSINIAFQVDSKNKKVVTL